MGKGKGHQSGGFARKSLRVQHQREWQERVFEDENDRRRRRRHNKTKERENYPKERPKLRLTSLLHMLQERQYYDQAEERGHRQKNSVRERSILSPPGSMVYHKDDDYGRDVRLGSKSLQELCLRTLAKSLPIYLAELGEDTLYHYLSLLTGPAITALSVYISESIGMNDSLIPLFNQSHVTRLSIYGPKNDDETDSHWKALTMDGLVSLIPTCGQHFPSAHPVPDSWEDASEDFDRFHWQGCRKLERIELGNMTHLQCETFEKLFSYSSMTTHLSLTHCCTFESGPEVLWRLHEWLPRILFLDLSGNAWITEELIRALFREYKENSFQIKAIGCLPQTSEVSLELDFGSRFMCN
mmetsp:Transcript_11840/g.18175  ORF Transcript_11840/g.18175 Transcript_11840/m.18175 type:complete len:355 (-) Transcript_11840:73-1137(-)